MRELHSLVLDRKSNEIGMATGSAPVAKMKQIYNPQSVITPESFVLGSTLDGAKTGTGAFKLDTFDPAVGATYVRNDDWWGGVPFLDKVEFIEITRARRIIHPDQAALLDRLQRHLMPECSSEEIASKPA